MNTDFYVVTFQSESRIVEPFKGWSGPHDQRRFIKAASREDAITKVKALELDNPLYWPLEYHRWKNLRAYEASALEKERYGMWFQ